VAADSARELYESERWHNSGGDRTWLAPERDFFYPKFPVTTPYVQPKQFDAGQFRVAADDQQATIRTEFMLRSYRAAADLPLSLTKTVSFADDPLRQNSSPLAASDLEFAGFRLRTSLVVQGPIAAGAWVGIWNLLQLPGGGELFAPTNFRSEPTIFFGDIPQGDLKVEPKLVRYRMQAPGEQKICISALAATGRLGYVLQEGENWVLVVRSFDVDPAGAYPDVWPERPDDDGYAVQACNINASYLGYFAEMEYHAPAIGANTREPRSDDTSLVWAYRGSRADICAAAQILLGIGNSI
jgi:hypothetical protein